MCKVYVAILIMLWQLVFFALFENESLCHRLCIFVHSDSDVLEVDLLKTMKLATKLFDICQRQHNFVWYSSKNTLNVNFMGFDTFSM